VLIEYHLGVDAEDAFELLDGVDESIHDRYTGLQGFIV
jgi:hypothetical protein